MAYSQRYIPLSTIMGRGFVFNDSLSYEYNIIFGRVSYYLILIT